MFQTIFTFAVVVVIFLFVMRKKLFPVKKISTMTTKVESNEYDILQTASNEYFENLSLIEQLWKEHLEQDSKEMHDKIWSACQEGILLFIKWTNLERASDTSYKLPKTIPCYKRSIMLLLEEKKYDHALTIIEKALPFLGESGSWMTQEAEKIKKLKTGTAT